MKSELSDYILTVQPVILELVEMIVFEVACKYSLEAPDLFMNDVNTLSTYSLVANY